MQSGSLSQTRDEALFRRERHRFRPVREAIRYDGEDATPIAYYDTDHPGASEIYSSAHDMALFGMFSLKQHIFRASPRFCQML